MALYAQHAPSPDQLSFSALLFAWEEESAEPPASATLPIYRVELVREGAMVGQPQITCPQDAAPIFAEYLKSADREHFVVMMLDTRNRAIGLHTVSIGLLDQALAHPREVFKPAILMNAASIVVCHNHPSGDVEASEEDKIVTRRLAQAGEILGIPLLDHVVIGEGGRFTSLKKEGAF